MAIAAWLCSTISSGSGQPRSTASRSRCSDPTPGLPPHENTSLPRRPHPDHLVVNQVRSHADQSQIPAALPDDLVPRGERDQVGEAFQRDLVAVAHVAGHSVL